MVPFLNRFSYMISIEDLCTVTEKTAALGTHTHNSHKVSWGPGIRLIATPRIFYKVEDTRHAVPLS